ncbi:hypothetical protein [Acidithiobacillus albertensis]|uniref:hypothetical protein n=1 Tax=Acidithiobacillus albertensis TaxID=119978 RepID=UPI00094B3556|nr:hypothetical protein [Acidithiobacillus albertensis]
MALFLNPNSVRGHSLYEEMVPYMAHYAWRMYIIPVGFTAQGRLLAAAEIAAPNVQAAIAEDERKFDVLAKHGGYPIQETQKDNPRILAIASIREKDNVRALKTLGKAVTPCLVWEAHGHWHIRYRPNIQTVKKAAESLENKG